MLVLYKSWKKKNEFKLTKIKCTWILENEKSSTLPQARSHSHPVTDPLGKTVDETGDSLSLPDLNTIMIINKIW